MNKSDRRLKTIESEQVRNSSNNGQYVIDSKKRKKQSSRKISLKQSSYKQHKDNTNNEPLTKHKKSYNTISEMDHRTKISKQLEQGSKFQQEHKKLNKLSNLSSKNSKSIVFAQTKPLNPHIISNHKSGKAMNSDHKPLSTITKDKFRYENRKPSYKGSTTKKHSKSVYNYTQFDDYTDIKKLNTKGSQPNAERSYHNRSSFTQQPHHISTSSITKRLSKSKSIVKKILNNSNIKKKVGHFKVLSNCLKTYIQGQEQSQKKIDAGQIIRLIQAFNKSQISKMSRPLEALISQMIQLIQQTVNKQKNQQRASDLKGSVKIEFQTPQRMKPKRQNVRSSQERKLNQFNIDSQVFQNPNDICKTKKLSTQHHQVIEKEQDSVTEQSYQTSLSKDVKCMQKGLEQLKSESKQLKSLIIQTSAKKRQKAFQKDQFQSEYKKRQIDMLRQILEKQSHILKDIEIHSDEQSNISESDESSLKYYPGCEQ